MPLHTRGLLAALVFVQLAADRALAHDDTDRMLSTLAGQASGALGNQTPQQMVDALLPRVGQIMGLMPRHNVKVVYHDATSLHALLLHALDVQYPGDKFERMNQVYQLIGLVPRDTALRAEVLRTFESAIVGTYDPFAGQMAVVRDAASGDLVQVLQHEVAHALQDQYWPLKALTLAAAPDEDQMLALQSIVEGQAVIAMYSGALEAPGASAEGGTSIPKTAAGVRAMLKAAGVDNLSDGDLQFLMSGGSMGADPAGNSLSALMPQAAQIPSSVAWLRAQAAFPYQEGTRFMEGLSRKMRFQTAIATVFATLPTSTAQIIHPELYLQHVQPVHPALRGVTAPWRVVYRNTIGELNIRTLFGGDHAGDDVATGWAGDTIVGVSAPGCELAAVWLTVWSNDTEAQQFLAAMRALAATRGSVTRLERHGARVAVLAGLPQGLSTAALLAHLWDD